MEKKLMITEHGLFFLRYCKNLNYSEKDFIPL